MADGRRSHPGGASMAGTAIFYVLLMVFPGAWLSSGVAAAAAAATAAVGEGSRGTPGGGGGGSSEPGARRGMQATAGGRTAAAGRKFSTDYHRRPRPSTENEAISRLSKVFGIDRVPIHRHHRSPPQYMVELYNTVAYQNGITRNPSPYGSDVVRGFPDRASREHMHFFFNVSYIKQSEKVLQGEFHVFRLRPRPPEVGSHLPRGVHLVELRLYQILDPRRMYQSEGLKLLDFRRISTLTHGWEVFKVKNAIQEWVNDSTKNHGFLMEATTLGGRSHVNGSYLRFAQRSEHHDSKQPVLVVFTEDQVITQVLGDQGDDLVFEDEGSPRQRRPVDSVQHRTYVQFLNERHRAKHGNYRIFPSSSKTFRLEPDAEAADVDGLYPGAIGARSRSRSSSAVDRRSKRSVDYYNPPARKRKETCARRELYVDFDEIGWSGWIISPKGYNAYHCKGECPFPLGQNQKPTNHATVQSIVHALRIGKDVGTPCCVPNKLYSFSLLYFDDDENVILKRYDDMVAASCGCH